MLPGLASVRLDPLSTTGAGTGPRYGQTAVWTGQEMLAGAEAREVTFLGAGVAIRSSDQLLAQPGPTSNAPEGRSNILPPGRGERTAGVGGIAFPGTIGLRRALGPQLDRWSPMST